MIPETEEYAAKLRAMMPELRERYGVTELGLFGSRVRGDHRPDSDLDVLAMFQPQHCLSYFKLAELNILLSDRLEVPVDLVPRDDLKPTIGRQVMKEVCFVLKERPQIDFLEDILKAAAKIQDDIRGMTFEQFESHAMAGDAVLRLLMVIGEASKYISKETRDLSPSIPWNLMVGMRNIIVHNYLEINYMRVWSTITTDLPTAIAGIQNLKFRLETHSEHTPEMP